MNKDQGLSVSRRAFVGRMTAGATGAALAFSLARSASAITTVRKSDADAGVDLPGETEPSGVPTLQPVTAKEPSAAPAPWHLLHPLRAGSSLARGWSVIGLTGVVGGACVLTLGNQRGREHRIHICSNGGSPQGLVYTDQFDLVVMNGGRGDLATEEDLGHAVAAVAHAIAANEAGGPRMSGLMPQSEREERFAAAAYLR